MKPQVDKSIYYGKHYLSPDRFASYGHQLQEIVALTPRNVLEVGIGNGLVSRVLREAGVELTTYDFDAALRPDVVGSVTDMPFGDGAFDVVACFEVLEHIPYEHVPRALGEIYRVCRNRALISLPDAAPSARLHIPRLCRERVLNIPFRRPRDHVFDGEHYWEINKKGYPLAQICALMQRAGFALDHTFRVWTNPYHRFFRLRKPISSNGK